MSASNIAPILSAAHAPSSEWHLHVLVPWAVKSMVTEVLSDAQEDVWDDGTPVVSEWSRPSLEILRKALEPLGCERMVWHRIFLKNSETVLDSIPTADNKVVVLNLVDGGESDGWPGVSVIRGLERRGLAYTGGCGWFFGLDTSKISMKQHLTDTASPTPAFMDLTNRVSEETAQDTLERLKNLPYPLLVKPSPSASSRGLTNKSVCYTPEEVLEVAREVKALGYPGVYAEEFVSGREFTALVSGDCSVGIRTYAIVERVFRKDVPEDQQFLSFGMKWDQYGAVQGNWWYALAPEADQYRLQDVARETMTKINGNGYCRMDIRQDRASGKSYVVDVNANCSIDYDPESAMALILSGSEMTFTDFLDALIRYGLERRAAEIRAHTNKMVHDFGKVTEEQGTILTNMGDSGTDLDSGVKISSALGVAEGPMVSI